MCERIWQASLVIWTLKNQKIVYLAEVLSPYECITCEWVYPCVRRSSTSAVIIPLVHGVALPPFPPLNTNKENSFHKHVSYIYAGANVDSQDPETHHSFTRGLSANERASVQTSQGMPNDGKQWKACHLFLFCFLRLLQSMSLLPFRLYLICLQSTFFKLYICLKE